MLFPWEQFLLQHLHDTHNCMIAMLMEGMHICFWGVVLITNRRIWFLLPMQMIVWIFESESYFNYAKLVQNKVSMKVYFRKWFKEIVLFKSTFCCMLRMQSMHLVLCIERSWSCLRWMQDVRMFVNCSWSTDCSWPWLINWLLNYLHFFQNRVTSTYNYYTLVSIDYVRI